MKIQFLPSLKIGLPVFLAVFTINFANAQSGQDEN